jgi:transcriptional regulator with XRE-family HTH domain
MAVKTGTTIKQARAADLLNMSFSYYQKLETGKKPLLPAILKDMKIILDGANKLH